MPDNTIGKRLQELREQRGLTQEGVAEACNIARISLVRYEAGTRIPRSDKVAKLARYYGVPVSYILGEDAPEEKNDLPTEQEIDGAIIALSEGLTPDEIQRVADFVAGLKAARKA